MKNARLIVSFQKTEGTDETFLMIIDDVTNPSASPQDNAVIAIYESATWADGSRYREGNIKSLVIPLPDGIDVSELIFLTGGPAIVNITILGQLMEVNT